MSDMPPPPPPSADAGQVMGAGLSSSRRRSFAIGGGVVVAALVGGGVLIATASGGGVETTQGPIDNAESFLADSARVWRSELPAEDITFADAAGCFFILDGNSLSTGQVACGGARTLGTAVGHTWSVSTFDVDPSATEGGAVTADAGSVSFADAWVTRPEGTLVDAEGTRPSADLDEVPAPRMPHADPGLVLTEVSSEGLALTDEITADEIIIPGGAVRVTSIATVESIANPEDDGRINAAADGETFRLVTWETVGDEDSFTESWSYDGPLPWIGVTSGGATTSVATDLNLGDDSGALVVSATDATQLVVSFDGHDQLLGLADGKRVVEPVTEVLYRGTTTTEPETQIGLATVDGWTGEQVKENQYSLSHSAAVHAATLTPYLSGTEIGAGPSWAPEGNAYLVIRVSAGMAANDVEGFSAAEPRQTVQTWRVEVDGKTYDATGPVILTDGWSDNEYTVVITVPATTAKAVLTLSAVTKVDGNDFGGTGTVDVDHGTGRLDLDFGPAR